MTTYAPPVRAADGGPCNRRVVATIVARNYTGFARVLTESVRAGHPDVDMVTLLVDGTETDRATAGVGRVVLPADLGIPSGELEPMVVMYTVMELSTALKPALLRHLLHEGYDAAAYLDPDILVKGSLEQVFAAACEHAIALTPHVLKPVPHDGLEIAERTVTQAGVFNLGFIAVGRRATDFLDWWHTRLATEAVVDFAAGLFTDQKWIDWVPALFEHTVLRDPGLNVAYWNMHERPLTADATGGVLAAGSPLVFVHFSGFNPATPWVLSRFTARKPRALVSESPVLGQLCLEYAALLDDAGHSGLRRATYGFDTIGDLVELTPSMRTVYRQALLGELPFDVPPLDPLSVPAALAEWFQRSSRLTPWFSLTPAEYALWLSRPDLRAAAPHPLDHSLHEFRKLLDHDMSATEMCAEPASTPGARSSWTVLAGGSNEPSGESLEVARRLGSALSDDGLDVEILEIASRTSDGVVRWENSAGWRNSGCENVVVCLDAGRFVEPELALQLEGCPGLRIGVWLTSDLSEVVLHPHFLHAFDEVWVLSDALADTVRGASPARVARVRVPMADEPQAAVLPQRTGRTVLAELDARAPVTAQVLEPTIGAYLDAVRADEGHRLLVRACDGHFAPSDYELLRHVCAGRGDVQILGDVQIRPSADVVLALDPRVGAGPVNLDDLRRGATVVTGTPGAAALEGIDDGVIRVPSDQGAVPLRPLVAAALGALCSGSDGTPVVARRAVGGGVDPIELVRAATGAGRRPDRGELRHRGVLEREVERLRAERDRLQDELAALAATPAVRSSRAFRAAGRRALGLVSSGLRRGGRW